MDVDSSSDEPGSEFEGPIPKRSKPGTSQTSPPDAPQTKNVARFYSLGKDNYFGSQKVLKGRVIDPTVTSEPGMARLVEKLRFQE